MSSQYTTMWTYPWDLHDEGYETVLQKLSGEIGLDAINLASAYHTFDMLRPHLPSNNTLEASQAAIYFHPQESLYGAIKPHISPLMQKTTGGVTPLIPLLLPISRSIPGRCFFTIPIRPKRILNALKFAAQAM